MTTTSPTPEAADPAPPAEDTGPGPFGLLLRRSWLLVLGALVGLGLAYLYVRQVPPKFTSSAQLLVIKKRPDMVPGMERGGVAPDDYVSTQANIIKSPLIVRRAVRDGNLAALKIFADSGDAAGSLLPALFVKRDLKDRANCVLELTFKGLDPEDTQTVLHAVIQSYQQFLREDYRKRSEETLRLIVASKELLEKELAGRETQYLDFRRKNPSLRKKGQGTDNIYNEMLLSLHARGLALRVRRAETEALLKSIEKGWKKEAGHEQLIALIYQLPSRAVGDSGGRGQSSFLEDKLLPALIEEQALLGEYAPTHPLLVAARKRVELAYKVVTSILKLDLAGIKTAEQSVAELFRAQDDEAQKAISAEVEDEILRNDITRIQQLSDSTIKRLQEVNVVKDLGGYDAEVIGPPTLGRTSLLASPSLILPAGALLGLLAGAGLAVVVPPLGRKRFPRSAELRRRLGWPIVGRIPFVRRGRKPALPDSPEAEAYRGVRTALFVLAGEAHRVIQITAADAGAGTSMLAANLAVSMAQAGKATLLIDGNLRRPSLHARFGLAAPAGLAMLLAEGGDAADVIQGTAIADLSLLPCGPVPPNPAELLSSTRFQALLTALRDQYDFVVIDTPPVLAVTDPAVVAARVDGILLVLRVRKKEPQQAERARELLETVHARVLGVVLNGVKGRGADGERGFEGYSSVR